MATVTLTETHVNRPEASADSYTTKTTAETMNSSMISGEPMESSIARAIKGRKSMDEYIRPVLDLQNPYDESPPNYRTDKYTITKEEEIKRPVVIDEAACLIRDTYLRPKNHGRRYGEVQVMFYKFNVIQADDIDLEDVEDIEDDDDYSSDNTAKREEIERNNRKQSEELRRRCLVQAAKAKGDSYEVIPLQYLYEKLSGLKIIEFPACFYATEFLETMQSHTNRCNFTEVDPQIVLRSRNLRFNKQIPGFKTGISLRATSDESDNDYLTLLTAMPYFGKLPKMKFLREASLSPGNAPSYLTEYRPVKGRESWRRESLSLAEYRFLSPGAEKESKRQERIKYDLKEERYVDQDVLIHQAWFMVIDNYTIGIFKSADDQLSDLYPQPPLYPHQEKIGAFNALVHTISNTLERSENIVLDTYRAKISELEFCYQSLINKDMDDLARAVEKVAIQISTINSVVQSQIQILKDLREIFRLSIGLASRRPQGANLQIPIMSDQKEQVRAAERSLSFVIKDRYRFSKTLDALSKDVKSLSGSLAVRGTQTAIARQNTTMSTLALISTLFFPLGFFTSYVTLDAAKTVVRTQSKFLRLPGPIAAVFIVATLAVIAHKNGLTDSFMKRLMMLRLKLRNYLLKILMKKRMRPQQHRKSGQNGAI
ncbi:uncharacterized protein LAJ45_00685 [Morchella importuna]|uniref:uncharacterized protein n=1 Tax=Morchella importuna TaxID=1174673 RepID=UPI001E8CC7E3|nr:uncharacterized protein LAJ45_00685 [Morchella importuna]KAH8155675.1 hypothetical protein LAJ45_00685 [Morchella importuna]